MDDEKEPEEQPESRPLITELIPGNNWRSLRADHTDDAAASVISQLSSSARAAEQTSGSAIVDSLLPGGEWSNPWVAHTEPPYALYQASTNNRAPIHHDLDAVHNTSGETPTSAVLQNVRRATEDFEENQPNVTSADHTDYSHVNDPEMVFLSDYMPAEDNKEHADMVASYFQDDASIEKLLQSGEIPNPSVPAQNDEGIIFVEEVTDGNSEANNNQGLQEEYIALEKHVSELETTNAWYTDGIAELKMDKVQLNAIFGNRSTTNGVNTAVAPHSAESAIPGPSTSVNTSTQGRLQLGSSGRDTTVPNSAIQKRIKAMRKHADELKTTQIALKAEYEAIAVITRPLKTRHMVEKLHFFKRQ